MAIGKKVSPARFIGAALGIAGGVVNMVKQQELSKEELEQQWKSKERLMEL